MSEHEPKSAQPAFDAEWYQRFQEAGGNFAAYDYLEGTAAHRNAQRQKFEAGEIENPTLDYPKLDPAQLKTQDQALLQLKADIVGYDAVGDERQEMVQQVYRWKINEKLAEVRLLQAAASGDMRRFRRYSKFVFGEPSPQVFAYTIERLRERVEQVTNAESQELQSAAADLLATLPPASGSQPSYQLPEESVFQQARSTTLSELKPLVEIPTTEGEATADQINQAFTIALERARLEGWRTVVDPNRANVSVSQEKRVAYIPQDKRVTNERLTGLILHEIGTHALRRRNGERSRLMLLGLGLDRYRDDEGVTGLREQVASNKMEDFSGFDGHLAVSLALGLDGQKRNFRQVYEVLAKYHLFNGLSQGKDSLAAQTEARTKAWQGCIRVFRGTDCSTPGVAFTKDILYREGNIDTWEVVRANPDEMLRFSVGKYDPANPRHILILDRLGITDEDLVALDSQ